MTNEVVPVNDLLNSLATISGGELDDDMLAVAGGGGNNKRISIKGGVFRKIVGGKEVGAIEDRHMNIIFVKMNPHPSRKYYAEGYVEGAKVSPVCWSNDAKVPNPEVKKPQAPSCDKCAWSVQGTGTNGQGTACRIGWRTAVVLPNDPAGDVMQLEIPGASAFGDKEESGRWAFRAYIRMLAARNVNVNRVVTKMSFDTKAPAPRVLFSPVAVVPLEDVETVKQQSMTKAAQDAITMTGYHRDNAGEAPEAAAPVAAEVEAVLNEAAEAPIPEPVVRAEGVSAAAPEKDVSAVIAKWAKKK